LGSVMALLSGPAVSGAINDPKNELATLAEKEGDDRKLVDEIFLRTLNRHATPKETSATLAAWSTIDPEHSQLTTALAGREEWWAPVYLQKQQEREQAIVAASAAVAARTSEIAAQVAEAEKLREEKIASESESLTAYEATLAEKQAAWEGGIDPGCINTAWVPLEVKTANANNQVKLKKLDDGSFLASGPLSNFLDYTITAESKLENITGVLLEVLPDESLPMFGPGRSAGNFVLSELTLRWSDKEARRNVEATFKDARADYTQNQYDVKGSINGKSEAVRDGWAIGGKLGEPHYARFSLAQPIGSADGATLVFVLQHRFREGLSIGRFRLWATTSKEPLEQGLPEPILAAVKTLAEQRADGQKTMLADYYRTIDFGLRKQQQALAIAKRPVPQDPKLTELKAVLAKAELPVPIDPKLVQLRADAAMSTKQLANKRLTGAQDLAWALVNNPAFLFNR
ncbi:MAG: hypothetical protein ACREF9_14070, partial [Opitutaceae bacterium]